MSANTYILIRTELNLCKAPNWCNRQRWEYLRQCLKSVVLQNGENIHIVMLQSGKGDSATPKPISKLPEYLKELINDIKNGWNNISLYSTSCKGAGCAQYLIRDIALDLAKDNDIFIQLDDDDYFTDNNAVKSIVEKFTDEVDICITGYKVVGDKSQDITNQAGSVHNQLLRGDDKEMSLAYADSLGWTKSYRAKAIKDYHKKLKRAENDILAYFEKNSAFEDFMDVITLCRDKSRIAFLDKATHCYRKHTLSITAKTDKEQFEQRANALVLTTQMSKQIEDYNYKKIVVQFCIIKILLIENILAKLRREEHNVEFNTTDLDKPKRRTGYFWYVLLWPWKYCCYYYTRLSHIWARNSTNGDFFRLFIKKLEKKDLLDYFADIAEKLAEKSAKKETNAETKTTEKSTKNSTPIIFKTPEEKIEYACEEEAKLGKVDVSNCFITTSIKQNDARINSHRWRVGLNIGSISVAICAIVWVVFFVKDTSADAGISPDVASLVISAMIAAISFCVNRILSLHTKRAEEEAKIDIYHEEIKELTRHLLANLNILKGLDESIEHGKVKSVGEIHFTNIKIPADSILLSNDPIQNSLCDDLNNIARLKVNIRNINNSADYLERLATKEKFDIEELHKAIQWEIVRYVGLLAQLRFFEENRNFKMPTIKQLKIYVNVRRIREYIASELAPKEKDKFDKIIEHKAGLADYDYVYKYMERFYKDREEKRDLLTFK